MNVADFGGGGGMTTHMLAEMVDPSGSVTGVDFSTAEQMKIDRLYDHAPIKA